MKNVWTKAGCLLVAAAFVMGCSSDDEKEKFVPELKVESSAELAAVSGKGTEIQLNILSNLDWKLAHEEWMQPDKKEGNGNAVVKVTILGNGLEECSGQLTISATGAEPQVLQVKQLANDLLTDIDGNEYKIVKIGEQYWMAENLKVLHLNDGTEIPYIATPTHEADGKSDWEIAVAKGPACAAYHPYDDEEKEMSKYVDAETYIKEFGLLYNYDCVASQKLCPEGWHVPVRAEWVVLGELAGNGDIKGAANALKATSGWDYYPEGTNGTDKYGFRALPGGEIGVFGGSSYFRQQAFWWGGDGASDYSFFHFSLTYKKPELYIGYDYKENGRSIRCVKD